ncbi:MAG: NADH-quinone oxidoreductase subunit NuoG [Candidatus Zixiibacteriota bacterium]|nr:MAG: NADH-quinone oxidoreductase subunit NuoG [candidate division Zixibacteria bacterium]
MADKISVTINNQVVEVPPGTLIVEAAKKIGLKIPTFCYDDRLRSVGACRMCLVEVEKMPKLIASCATPVAPNMVIHTDSEKVKKAREGVLEFQLINHPLDCPTCDKGGECPLQDNTYLYGPTRSAYKENKIRFMNKEADQKFDDFRLGPEIYYNANRCIMCFKCTRIVRELAGEADLGIFERGANSYIGIMKELEFADEYSGNTVEYCPVGALTSGSFRYKIREWLLKKTPSVCSLCAVGCNMYVDWSRNRVYRHMARRNDEVDAGWLCDRGRYGFDISSNKDRIYKTHIRRGSSLEPCGWEEAAAVAVKYFTECIDDNRGAEIAAIGSASLSNEEAYAIRKFFGDVVKTEYIDFQTEFGEPLGPDVLNIVGLDGRISDLEDKGIYIFVGCDPAIEFPVASLRIRKAISGRGARAVFITPYHKRLGYFPVTNIRISGGSEAFALEYLHSRIVGSDFSMPDGLIADKSELDNLANEIKNSDSVHIISGRGFFDHPDRSALLSSMSKLKKICNAGLSIIPTQVNFMGVSRFGLYGGPGRSFVDILDKINSGAIKSLFVFGSDPIEEFPDRKYVNDTLKKLEFLVVVTPFINSLTNLASLVFPQMLPSDYSGSFMNMERRIQRFEAGPENIHYEMKPVWAILGEFSDLMDAGNVWYHDSQVREDIAKYLTQYSKITNIPEDGLIVDLKDENKLDFKEAAPEIPPGAGSDLPYILNWTLSVHHSGWITQKSANLMNLAGKQKAWMHPEDARKEEIESGQVVRIGNKETAINIKIKVTDKINKGELLILNSFEDNPINRLLKRNEKATFVSVRKV